MISGTSWGLHPGSVEQSNGHVQAHRTPTETSAGASSPDPVPSYQPEDRLYLRRVSSLGQQLLSTQLRKREGSFFVENNEI